MAEAPKPYSKKETAYQKQLRTGNKKAIATRKKGYVANSSLKGIKRINKAKAANKKYAGSNWAVADNIASELLKELTSAREVKKALYGKASKGDYARIAGNVATYLVPYGKINKTVNAVVGGKAVKSAVKSAKATSKAKGSGKVKSTVRATTAGVGATGRKTVRGTGKLGAALVGATAADKIAQSTINKVAKSKKKR